MVFNFRETYIIVFALEVPPLDFCTKKQSIISSSLQFESKTLKT